MRKDLLETRWQGPVAPEKGHLEHSRRPNATHIHHSGMVVRVGMDDVIMRQQLCEHGINDVEERRIGPVIHVMEFHNDDPEALEVPFTEREN